MPDVGFVGNLVVVITSYAGTPAEVSETFSFVVAAPPNVAPVIDSVQVTQIPIYGYIATSTGSGGFDDPVTYSTAALYSPQPGYETPIAYKANPNSGSITARDPDNTAGGLTYAIVGQAAHGTASVDGAGNWSFSARDLIGGSDAFVVAVTDARGGSATTVVSVPLPNPVPQVPTDPFSGNNPIILDLNGTGFHFTPLAGSTAFVQTIADGLRHQTAWVSGGNGVLAFDKYGDGKVRDVSQIAFQGYLPGAQTDLEGLSAFDSNHDGMISALDARYAQLGVWVDTNQDGADGGGEYKSLATLGIKSINLTSDKQFAVDQGVVIHGKTSFTRTDGSTGAVADVTLPTNGKVLDRKSVV